MRPINDLQLTAITMQDKYVCVQYESAYGYGRLYENCETYKNVLRGVGDSIEEAMQDLHNKLENKLCCFGNPYEVFYIREGKIVYV